MPSSKLRTIATLAVAALVLTACPRADDDPPDPGAQPGPTPETVPDVPPEVAAAAAEWPMGNRDYANTRATTDALIDAGNVAELGVAWSMPLEGAGDWGLAASTPLILDGVVYFQDLRSNVAALDLDSGEVLWEAAHDSVAIGPNGVAVGWDKVVLQDGDVHLIALARDDGRELWRTALEPHTGTHQPLLYGGYVYTGTGAGQPPSERDDAMGRESYAGGTSGMVYAVEQGTGEIVWQFQVVEEGFWGAPEINSGGGLWYPPAIDTQTGMTFWGTGNPAPFPGTVDHPNASSRPGPNLYTNTMLALDGRDGELRWHNQVRPGDLFDLDFQSSPVLASVEVDGATQELVIGSGKLGEVYAFDRATGETVWQLPVGVHQDDDLQEIPIDEETLVYPGVWGGVETPMAYEGGVLYLLTLNLGSRHTGDGHGAETPGEAIAATEGRTFLEEAESELVAIDVATGAIVWTRDFPTSAFGGATVVNDLVLTATHDGVIHALSRDDGTTVWSMQAPGGIIAWPAVAGETIVWPVGLGRTPVLLALRLGADGAGSP